VNAKRSEANQQIRDMLKEKKVQKEAEIQHSRATAAQQVYKSTVCVHRTSVIVICCTREEQKMSVVVNGKD
jgi:type III secretory pathway component EscU